ncbi:putative ATP-dependent endonuclease of OLD family [Bradyrhizobium japonicum]|uniref:AAA family ATPase n=1 Tax=Bradyrhizobium japonicum TaxID=375 RepID=UPI002227F978|nr:AAA family ATPase [Bradyrhizobium japonicum]MCW2223684.1 putative ATP-dependent endonuclease of OLD family [Bradyrhizobium japonicum]MCW2348296.1 putative ATP-dependent endonuclease of OLD family [Bradyrhizobium japonicum]
MKISELRMWGFRCFKSANPFTPTDISPVVVSFDPEITALIGRNGSGKSALLEALQRLFGETREERNVRAEDFFVSPGETIDKLPKREFFVEVLLSFSELNQAQQANQYTVPAAYHHMVVDGPGQSPTARIRLEATWQSAGTLDGIIEENIYWLLTTDAVPFGPPLDANIKRKMTAAERASIAVRYIPASRDVTALTRLTVRALGRSMLQSIHWQHEAEIRKLVTQASAALDSEEALARVNDCINACWTELNTADTETSARLSVISPDFQQIVRAASIALDSSPSGRPLGIEDLSDGQRSLFHFALVKSLLDFKLALEADVAAGKKPPFRAEFMRAPALTIFAFEEPENHLAPFFLSRLITELQKLTASQRVQGVVTSHSPSIVGRLEPTALRYLNRNGKTGNSVGSPLQLPPDGDEAGKFVREAVRAHPEIYFARHAIFGEGASEEVVLPRLAEALDVPIDRSFVAIVPVGGRYINHFWRLVTQLGIPHTTLLDFDCGRSSGDIAQIKAIAKAILEFKLPPDQSLREGLERTQQFNRELAFGVEHGWDQKGLKGWTDFFEQYGVFFSAPLDLDMLMLEAFPNEYKKLPPGMRGPQAPDDPIKQTNSAQRVLGDDGFGPVAYKGTSWMQFFPWYAYLFLGARGKPAIHLSALSGLSNQAIKNGCPAVISRLIRRVAKELTDPSV